MPQEGSDPISHASQGANWLVGLSGAAIGGALAKLDWVLKFPPFGKALFFLASFSFMLSILAGVYYAFQLYALKARKQKLAEELARQPPVDADVQQARTQLDTANGKVRKFHFVAMSTFAVSCFFTAACLVDVLAQNVTLADPSSKAISASTPEPNHYTLANVPVHVRGQLSHSHTFLLDQLNGRIWQMTCHKGTVVEFRRVLRIGLDGLPDDVPANAAAENEKPVSPH